MFGQGTSYLMAFTNNSYKSRGYDWETGEG